MDEPTCEWCQHPAHPDDTCEVDLGEFGDCQCAGPRQSWVDELEERLADRSKEVDF